MVIPYQHHQKARQQNQQTRSSSSLQKLYGIPFWIWDQQRHKEQHIVTDGQCCFNHIVGLPVKDNVEHPLYDYERLLYDSLLNVDGSFKDKHLWVKKATGLGVTEFMLRIMAWLCTNNNNSAFQARNSQQMCIVTGPNIDIAIKLIRRLKNIFERKLGLTFPDKETVLIFNNCRIEAFPSNRLDAYRALENPKFILLDESDFWRKSEVEDVRHVSERYIGKSDPYIVMISTPNAPGGLENWADVCQTIQNYLLNDCSSYVASSGSLTSEGMRARDCIQGGGLLAGAGLLANLAPLWIIGILERASVMYKGGVCDGIVYWQSLKTDVTAACFFLNIVGVPCLGV
jgi:hypothetical protein